MIDGQSLLEPTLGRVAAWNSTITLVASEEHRFMVLDSLHKLDLQGNIVEPEGRNTTAAMALAAIAAPKPEDLLLLSGRPSLNKKLLFADSITQKFTKYYFLINLQNIQLFLPILVPTVFEVPNYSDDALLD